MRNMCNTAVRVWKWLCVWESYLSRISPYFLTTILNMLMIVMMRGSSILFLKWCLYWHWPYFGKTRVKLIPDLIPDLIEELPGIFKSGRRPRTSERTNLTATEHEIVNGDFGCRIQFSVDQYDIRPEKRFAIKMFTSLRNSHFNDETVPRNIAVRENGPPPQDTPDGTYHVARGSRGLIKNLSIKRHASLPHYDKFLVKERIDEINSVKLKLKSCQMSRYIGIRLWYA